MVTVIIPVHNLERRGLDRVYWSLMSLSLQTQVPKMIVSDSSKRDITSYLPFDFVRLIRNPREEFNKPKLLNDGIKEADTKYVMCTDADYLFSFNLIERLLARADSTSFFIKRVIMLPNQPISKSRIEKWDFQKGDYAPGGRTADGGCQFAPKAWFTYCGGYDERMKGWCGMDNDMTKRARLAGMNVQWFDEGEILHQYHKQEKLKKGPDIVQSKQNWRIRDNDNTIFRNHH